MLLPELRKLVPAYVLCLNLMSLARNAQRLAKLLEQSEQRVVFAESCTGGLVAATMAQIPGISDWLCGSTVTYRGDCKIKWLGVEASDVKRNQAVNPAVARQMAALVLTKTPEAAIAGAITGHLGPGAGSLDGVVYTGVAKRQGKTVTQRHNLTTATRRQRQREAAALLLEQVADML